MGYIFSSRKSFILIVVVGIALVISTLVLAVFSLMSHESRIAEGKIRRIRTIYALQAGMVNAVDNMRRGNPITATIYVGNGLAGYPAGGIPVSIQRANGAGISGTDRITINANY